MTSFSRAIMMVVILVSPGKYFQTHPIYVAI